MSTPHDLLVRPSTGERVQTYRGFSWPCLFFGVFWYMAKGMLLYGLLALIVVTFTFGFAWLVLPFMANGAYRAHLLKNGFVPAAGDLAPPTPQTHVRCPECRELVRMDARLCKHCGTKLVPQA